VEIGYRKGCFLLFLFLKKKTKVLLLLHALAGSLEMETLLLSFTVSRLVLPFKNKEKKTAFQKLSWLVDLYN